MQPRLTVAQHQRIDPLRVMCLQVGERQRTANGLQFPRQCAGEITTIKVIGAATRDLLERCRQLFLKEQRAGFRDLTAWQKAG